MGKRECTLEGNVNWCSHCGNSMVVSQKLPYNPTIPLLGIYSKKPKNIISKTYMHPNVHSNIIYNHQDMEAIEVFINRWMDKEAVVYICNLILLIHKKEWNFDICNNMHGLRGYYAKWNKSDRERQITLWHHFYVKSKE